MTGDSGSAAAPLFSVIVPAYNAEDTLAETLDAIRLQTHEDWECIIVDDGSTDTTFDLARSVAAHDERLRVVQQPNRGTGGAYNTGVRAAVGEWVVICSADDLLAPEHLELMAEAIREHPDHDIFSCNGYYLQPDGSLDVVYRDMVDQAVRSWSMKELLERCFFSVGATYRRSLFALVGGYDEDIFGEDYDFWLRAMARGARHLYIPSATATHRLSATQKSASHVRALQSDVRSIRSLMVSGLLDDADSRAARDAIKSRQRLIRARGRLARATYGVRRRFRRKPGGTVSR